jgi:hypothetical protein
MSENPVERELRKIEMFINLQETLTEAKNILAREHQIRMRSEQQRDELLEALEAAIEWIDAVPSNVQLPTMPGFDRDWVEDVIAKAKGDACEQQ